MSFVVSIHSFRGGTGKSNLTANLSTIMAMEGKRVAVIDTDIQSPGVHVLFQLSEDKVTHTLNDFLWGKCSIEEAAYDVTPDMGEAVPGTVYLVPSSIKPGDIARILREGYDVGLLNEGFQSLLNALDLDALVIDTHPGLNEETLLSIAVSDVLIIILRPDQQDFQGTGVTVDVARRLSVPAMLMVLNKVPDVFDFDQVQDQVETAYDCDVAGILPHTDDMMILASDGVFTVHYPDHPITKTLQSIAHQVLEAGEL